jgi:hypothetical protein
MVDITKKNPTNSFSANILKTIVGDDRAKAAFNSISLSCIPSSNDKGGGKKLSLGRK